MDVITEIQDLKKKVERLEKRQKPSAWMTLEELLGVTGYSVKYIYKLNHKRTFTTRKAGGLQFKRSSVERYLESRERKSIAELKEAA